MKRKTVVPWRGLSSQLSPNNLFGEVPWQNIPDEFNRVVENFLTSKPFGKVASLWAKEGGIFEPAVDVEEHAQEIVVRAELAGMKEDDVELLLNNDVLTLRGEKKVEKREDGYYESRHGMFERVIPLGVEVAADKVEASMKDGVLVVKLPKIGSAKEESKKISIKTSPKSA